MKARIRVALVAGGALVLAGCATGSGAPPESADCVAILHAIGTYAATQPPPARLGIWAGDLQSAAGVQVNDLQTETSGIAGPTALQQSLIANGIAIYDDATAVASDAGQLAVTSHPPNLTQDLSDVRADMRNVYQACDQTMPGPAD